METNYKAAIAAVITCALVIICITFSISQAHTIDSFIKSVVHGPHIGELAPSFKGQSTKGTITFPENYGGKWVILFSYPSDFRPVSDSEFKKIASMVSDFEKLNARLIALSPDSTSMHKHWIDDLAKQEKDDKKSASADKLSFPVIADEDMSIAQKYDMIHTKESKTETIRSVYIIDPSGHVRAILHYPIANGRNFSEVKRLLQALQTTDKQKVATLADWDSTPARTIPMEKESKSMTGK